MSTGSDAERCLQGRARLAASPPPARPDRRRRSASQEISACADRREAIFASVRESARPTGWRNKRGDKRHGKIRREAGEGRVKNAILIAGPTASGKSALALELAERTAA